MKIKRRIKIFCNTLKYVIIKIHKNINIKGYKNIIRKMKTIYKDIIKRMTNLLHTLKNIKKKNEKSFAHSNEKLVCPSWCNLVAACQNFGLAEN